MKTVLVFLLTVSLSQCKLPLTFLKLQATQFVKTSNTSANCATDFSLLISDLFEMKMWALKMFDATTKLDAGILSGNVHFFGDYDLCVSIKEKTKTRTVEGKYCSAIITLNTSFTEVHEQMPKLKNWEKSISTMLLPGQSNDVQGLGGLIGICVPKSCTLGDLETLTGHVESKFKIPIHLSFREELCVYKNKSIKINKLDLLGLHCFFYSSCIFIFIGVVLVASTFYDVYLQGSGTFKIFSVYTNLKKALHQAENKKLNCLNGIKVISCLWVIYGHTAIIVGITTKNLVYQLTEWRYWPSGIFACSGHYAVDTFFMLSGLLVSYGYLKNSQNLSTSLIAFYFKRLSRLLPTMGIVVLIQIALLKLFINGPFGHLLVDLFIEKCYDNWPSMVFCTFNFMRDFKCGINHLWYMSSDTQMYLLAPIFLFFIRKHPRKVIAGMVVTFLFAVGYSVAVTFMKNLGFTYYDWSNEFAYYLSFSTIHRLPSWLIGVFCGYLLQFQNVKILKKLNIFLLLVSFLSMILLIMNQLSLMEGEYNVYRFAVWNGLARPAWSSALAYIIFSCATGHGGIIDSFLSHYVFSVLSKLTFGMYLVHIGMILVMLGNSRQSLLFNNRQILLYFGELCARSLPLALLVYLTFEAPLSSVKDYMSKHQKVMADKTN
ncbi:hypothetical protein Zmor_019246 [Zophobas morio]|uniref:Nose resistant-to-fluoxetine protein N-terminal domain-containing protein n=1 Tax=Zophobas morio TaxID=2755281 RepID=A0AA38I376_9CUCU|nr:hypothetical protein Zmor_019246 [Zophobas morio]